MRKLRLLKWTSLLTVVLVLSMFGANTSAEQMHLWSEQVKTEEILTVEPITSFNLPNITFGLDQGKMTAFGEPLEPPSPTKLRATVISKDYSLCSVRARLRPGGGFMGYGMVFYLAIVLTTPPYDFIAVGYIWEHWKYSVPYYPYYELRPEVHIAVEKQFQGVKTLIYLDQEIPSAIVTQALTKETEFTVVYSYHGVEWYIAIDRLLIYATPAGEKREPASAICGGISACRFNQLVSSYKDVWLSYWDNGNEVFTRWSQAATFEQEPYYIERIAGTFEEPIDWETGGGEAWPQSISSGGKPNLLV